MRLLRFSVEVIDRVLVECVLVIAIQNVVQPWRVCKAENAIPDRNVSSVRRSFDSSTHDGVNFGAQTIATLSGIMT